MDVEVPEYCVSLRKVKVKGTALVPVGMPLSSVNGNITSQEILRSNCGV